MLRVIDISNYQSDLNLAAIANQFDAVMIKATGGNGYVNPSCDKHVQQAIALGKKWGVYHYFSDGFNSGNPVAEADFFVDNCLGYIGNGLLCLDWEGGGNPFVNDTNMARQFTQRVKARTGVNCGDYMSLSLVKSLNWSGSIADNNWLWCAAYVDNNTPIANFSMDAKRDPNPVWDGVVNNIMWQFTSTGRLNGYGGNLDCSLFYGTRETWDAYARKQTPTTPPASTTTTTTTAMPTTTTTTTTTVAVDPTPEPDEPTTTTTTTLMVEPTPTTTTTTVASENQPTLWQAIIAFFIGIFDYLRGERK